ncbi:MFS transporter [Massilia sp. CF038]|uniref:MFS transporter n=1 Tax=Massilia sp. CF038 TaxID=1881045 RepID=UPI00091358BD|nr:MFS transporter [Massilia sp. CF038]SHH53188.1 Predicted arabinose efflux permease, MFS family [Massilia sp. CF038]
MKRIIALVAGLQFVYILDFIMLLPLGPDLAHALGFPADQLGMLTASYTLASLLSGLIALRLLDRFERKRVLLLSLAALALATFATTLADSAAGLLLARALTGFAGAPLMATGMAMVIDITPPAGRGRAIAKVMLGFSAAALAGVPLALELSRIGGWQTPFQALALIAVLLWICAARLLPSGQRGIGRGATLGGLLRQPLVRQACLVQALSQFSAFLLIPHFSAYFLLNLGFPRERLGLLYLTGGVTALLAVQVLGRLVDRRGPKMALALASAAMGLGLLPFFADLGAFAIATFVLFMAGNAGRNISVGAALSHVPSAHERAGFMALQSMVQDLSIAAAAITASYLLAEGEDGRLINMSVVAAGAALVGCAVPWTLHRLADQKAYSRTT